MSKSVADALEKYQSGDIENAEKLLEDKKTVRKMPEMTDADKKRIEKIMIEWVQVDDDISQINTIKKELMKKKGELTDQLIKMMETFRIPEINIDNDQAVQYSVKETRAGYTKRYVTNLISELLPKDQSEYLLEELEKRRPVAEKHILKRT